ncbi:MAG: transcriptional repressor [Bacteroidales bacterium]|jgi:Fe2+ or Zn2+ uptake regulation protein|nr:transcriptional repressor [Bacteroidales bacterium]
MAEQWNINTVKQYLIEKDIKPSVQRLAVMTYLLEHRTHPTVEEIFNDLKDKIPTISKTTIYNTLKLLALKKAILSITIDEKMVRYDGYVDRHAHFICLSCGKVVDVPLKEMIEFPKTENVEGFALEETHVYHRGYCMDCLKEN